MHTEVTRADNALRKIFNWKQTPGQDAYKHYFKTFDQSINQNVSKHFFTWFFQNINIDHFTLDIDSTIMTRYGSQLGAKKGYNPKKKDRISHHLLIAFVGELRMVANFWLRSGNSSSVNNFTDFLAETLSIFSDKKIGLVRLDLGFCQKDVFDY
ncbi:transposase [Snuella lapsa]|uniref:transposase n=1 Tax=Snuella lapsa TaxID=870481 RepID=UPI0031F03D50